MNERRLEEILEIYGPSGGEGLVREWIENEIKDFVDEISVDVLGNLIAHKKGNGTKVMFTAAMDEPGFMVSYADEKGFLRFAVVGGEREAQNLLNREVIFANSAVGVIGCEGLAAKSEPMLANLFIDTGGQSDIKLGDVCVIHKPVVIDDTKIISSAANRLGCYVLIEALEQIESSANDLYFVFTVQKAMKYRGAEAAVYTVDPDVCISVGITMAFDTPKSQALPVKAGKGAAIKVKDRGVLCHPKIYGFLEECAKSNNIACQHEIVEDAVSELMPIHVSRGGVPASGISIPARHGEPVNLCLKSDISDCIALAAAAAKSTLILNPA